MFSEFQGWEREKRRRLFKPILLLLKKSSCTPNGITAFRMLLAIPLYLIFLYDQGYGIFFYFFIYLLDGLDGAYARFLNKSCDRGKFLDVFTDCFVYLVLVIAILSTTEISPLAVAIHLVLLPSVFLLSAIYKFENKPSNWIIYPSPRKTHYILIILTVFVLDYFVKTTLLPSTFFLVNCVLAIEVGILFTRLMLPAQKNKK